MTEDKSPSPPEESVPTTSPYPPLPRWAVWGAVALALCYILFTYPDRDETTSPHSLTASEEVALVEAMSRELQLWHLGQSTPTWGSILLFGQADFTSPAKIIEHYEENYIPLDPPFGEAQVKNKDYPSLDFLANMAVIKGEAGQLREGAEITRELSPRHPLLALAVYVAYLKRPISPEEVHLLQANLDQVLSPLWTPWLRARLTMALAYKMEDHRLLTAAKTDLDRREDRTVTWGVLLYLIEQILILAGFLAFIAWWWKKKPSVEIASAQRIAPWPGRRTVFTLALSLAIGGSLSLVFPFLPWSEVATVLEKGTYNLLVLLPLLWWSHQFLYRPQEKGLIECWGMELKQNKKVTLVALTLAAISLNLIGSHLIPQFTSILLSFISSPVDGGTSPALLSSEFLFLSPTARIADSWDAAVWTPLVEEIAFRALVYTSLRRYMSVGKAAVWSSVLFAAVHPQYDFAQLTGVFWSGLVWAWIYEKSGSLWPCILAHGVHNGLVSMWMFWMWSM